VIVALVCALCAVAYGVLTTRSLLALSPGNAEMVRISGAVQQGARALSQPPVHDDRDRRRRAGHRADLHPERVVAIGFVIGGIPVRLDRLHRHERLGARERPASRRPPAAASRRRSPRLSAGGAITGLLVVGLALIGGRRLLRHPHRVCRQDAQAGRRQRSSASASAAP